MGFASILFLLAWSYYASEWLIADLPAEIASSPNSIIPEAFEESLASGVTVEKTVRAYADSVLPAKEVTESFVFQRDYYENEFTPNLSISITFECQTAACEVRESRFVEFVKDASLRSRTTCIKTTSSANCKITFYDTVEKPAELGFKPKNPLQRELFAALEPEAKRIVSETRELKDKNPLEKAVLFWSGIPQNLASSTITFTARLGIISHFTGAENHFFQAQQKYGLKYPDGSKTPQEFVSHVKQTFAGKTSSYPSTQAIATACASELESPESPERGLLVSKKIEEESKKTGNEIVGVHTYPSLLASGIRKLFAYSASFPACSLTMQLEALARNDFPESSILYSFPESESIEEQVRRAMIVYTLDRYSKKGGFDAFPVISAENQITWLNKTGNTNALERITFIEGAKTDFSGLEKRVGQSGVSLDEELARIFELNGFTLTVKRKISAFLKTKRECATNSACTYAIIISPSWK